MLQSRDTTSRVDYVKGEFERLKSEFCERFDSIFAEEGVLSRKLDDFFGEKGELQKTLEDHFGEDGSVALKILNPNDSTTPLGQFTEKLKETLQV